MGPRGRLVEKEATAVRGQVTFEPKDHDQLCELRLREVRGTAMSRRSAIVLIAVCVAPAVLAFRAPLVRKPRLERPFLPTHDRPLDESEPRPCACRGDSSRLAASPCMLWGGSSEPVPKLRRGLLGIGWVSWWSQAILSTISAVLLLFANTVTVRPTALTILGRALTLGGLVAAIASTLWTVAYGRLARRLGRATPPTAEDAAERAANIATVGTWLNIVGMVLCLLGAEAIVGTLAAKALQSTSGTAITGSFIPSPVQALDLLIVQANTNTLLAHFVSLCANMRLRGAATACEAAAANA